MFRNIEIAARRIFGLGRNKRAELPLGETIPIASSEQLDQLAEKIRNTPNLKSLSLEIVNWLEFNNKNRLIIEFDPGIITRSQHSAVRTLINYLRLVSVLHKYSEELEMPEEIRSAKDAIEATIKRLKDEICGEALFLLFELNDPYSPHDPFHKILKNRPDNPVIQLYVTLLSMYELFHNASVNNTSDFLNFIVENANKTGQSDDINPDLEKINQIYTALIAELTKKRYITTSRTGSYSTAGPYDDYHFPHTIFDFSREP